MPELSKEEIEELKKKGVIVHTARTLYGKLKIKVKE